MSHVCEWNKKGTIFTSKYFGVGMFFQMTFKLGLKNSQSYKANGLRISNVFDLGITIYPLHLSVACFRKHPTTISCTGPR